MTTDICKNGICVACGACENICPKKCIKRVSNTSSIIMLKGKECIHCGLCENVCPVNNKTEKHSPLTAYIAYSSDENIRKTSASGGIAASLYQFCLDNGYWIAGAEMTDTFECHFKLTNSKDDILSFQNSKYTYSYLDQTLKAVKQKLDNSEKVLFIGLPCQAAALRNYLSLSKTDTTYLIVGDIICHGTPHPDYLKEHISSISSKRGKTSDICFFRDPKFGTQNFVFSLYNNCHLIYKAKVDEADLYQIGFHKALIYRNCCYSCNYAQFDRVGDFTLGDYHVKDIDECDVDTVKKSLILVNTLKGKKYIENAVEMNSVVVLERPLEEPRSGEPQLRHPSVAGSERVVFLSEYEKSKDFDKAAAIAFKKIVFKRKLKIDKTIFSLKMFAKKIVPRKLYKKAKQAIKGEEN